MSSFFKGWSIRCIDCNGAFSDDLVDCNKCNEQVCMMCIKYHNNLKHGGK